MQQPGAPSLNLILRCGHCKQFAPEYEKIASTLKSNDPPIAVAKIDATSASMLAGRFDVSGYPTIKILKKGQAVDYEGSRTHEGELVPEHSEGSRHSGPQEEERQVPRAPACWRFGVTAVGGRGVFTSDPGSQDLEQEH